MTIASGKPHIKIRAIDWFIIYLSPISATMQLIDFLNTLSKNLKKFNAIIRNSLWERM